MKDVNKKCSQRQPGLKIKSGNKSGFGGIGTGKLNRMGRKNRAYSRQLFK